MPRLVIVMMLLALALGAGSLFLFSPDDNRTGKPGETSARVSYALTDGDGNVFTEKSVPTPYSLVFFGYTYCPDVCPTTLSDMAVIMELLGDAGKRLTPLFITVDPKRDTPDVMKDYASNFHPAIIGLSGDVKDTNAAVKAFGAYYNAERPDKDDPDSYLVSHTAYLYLMGPNGAGPLHRFKYGDTPKQIAERLKPVISGPMR